MLKLIKRLDFAFIDCDESVLFRGGDRESRLPIGCFAWLLLDDTSGKYTLIDTGVTDIDAVNGTKRGVSVWHRSKNGKSLAEHLTAMGIDAKNVQTVVISHAHYDHLSGIPCLPFSKIYMTQAAYKSAIDPQNPNAKYLEEAARFLQEQNDKGMVIFTSDNQEIMPGLSVLHAAAHTAGDQLIQLQNDSARYLFTGDALFLLENIRRNLPIGFGNDPQEGDRVLALCKKFKGKIMTGHDLGCVVEEET